ncbi:alpha/beta hydrolase family protein [Aneurinibacillus tyrosinisolvens]|uniref:alpha/beta hydrolase family protein n=1 Tax=Aneurinibacillus tyrosinisolvens TaxID=1443435 RepID=UPI00069C1633|nr:alpha/beta hydrolase family protein [Aneurinibacillus tyrosinisolvens]
MANRNFSLWTYFMERGAEIRPSLAYQGGDVREWQPRLLTKVQELLGDFPPSVPLEAETIWKVEENGLIKEKIVFNSEPFASIPALVIRGAELSVDRKHPGLLCLHGHGPFGKDSVAGVRSTQAHRDIIQLYNYDYAVQFARQGYITITPDFRNFGERSDGDLYPGRDSCNVHFIRGLLMGINLITLNIWDIMKTMDYFMGRPEVDENRIGAIGLSFGGTMVLHSAGLDSRIKAAGIVCALTTYEEYAIKMGNFCGSQFIPGIYQYADLADLAGLIAPRPLLIENGVFDDGFPIEASLKAQEQLKRIYQAAGAENRLEIDLFEGAHQFSGRKAFSFFEKWL